MRVKLLWLVIFKFTIRITECKDFNAQSNQVLPSFETTSFSVAGGFQEPEKPIWPSKSHDGAVSRTARAPEDRTRTFFGMPSESCPWNPEEPAMCVFNPQPPMCQVSSIHDEPVPRKARASQDELSAVVQKLAVPARLVTAISFQNGLVDGSISSDEAVAEFLYIKASNLDPLEKFDKTKMDTFAKKLKDLEPSLSANQNTLNIENMIILMNKWRLEYTELGDLGNTSSADSYFKAVENAKNGRFNQSSIDELINATKISVDINLLENGDEFEVTAQLNELNKKLPKLVDALGSFASFAQVMEQLKILTETKFTSESPQRKFAILLDNYYQHENEVKRRLSVHYDAFIQTIGNASFLVPEATKCRDEMKVIGEMAVSRTMKRSFPRKFTNGFLNGFSDIKHLPADAYDPNFKALVQGFDTTKLKQGLHPLEALMMYATKVEKTLEGLSGDDSIRTMKELRLVSEKFVAIGTPPEKTGIMKIDGCAPTSRILSDFYDNITGLFDQTATVMQKIDPIASLSGQLSDSLLSKSPEFAKMKDTIRFSNDDPTTKIKEAPGILAEIKKQPLAEMIKALHEAPPLLAQLKGALDAQDVAALVQSIPSNGKDVVSKFLAADKTKEFQKFFNCMKVLPTEFASATSDIILVREIRQLGKIPELVDKVKKLTTTIGSSHDDLKVLRSAPGKMKDNWRPESEDLLKAKDMKAESKSFGDVVTALDNARLVLKEKDKLEKLMKIGDNVEVEIGKVQNPTEKSELIASWGDFNATKIGLGELLVELEKRRDSMVIPVASSFAEFSQVFTGWSGLKDVEIRVAERRKTLERLEEMNIKSQALGEVKNLLKDVGQLDLQFARFNTPISEVTTTLGSLDTFFASLIQRPTTAQPVVVLQQKAPPAPIPVPLMSETTTVHADSSTTSEWSLVSILGIVGIVLVVLFFIVLVVILYFKRKCCFAKKMNESDNDSSSDSSTSSSHSQSETGYRNGKTRGKKPKRRQKKAKTSKTDSNSDDSYEDRRKKGNVKKTSKGRKRSHKSAKEIAKEKAADVKEKEPPKDKKLDDEKEKEPPKNKKVEDEKEKEPPKNKKVDDEKGKEPPKNKKVDDEKGKEPPKDKKMDDDKGKEPPKNKKTSSKSKKSTESNDGKLEVSKSVKRKAKDNGKASNLKQTSASRKQKTQEIVKKTKPPTSKDEGAKPEEKKEPQAVDPVIKPEERKPQVARKKKKGKNYEDEEKAIADDSNSGFDADALRPKKPAKHAKTGKVVKEGRYYVQNGNNTNIDPIPKDLLEKSAKRTLAELIGTLSFDSRRENLTTDDHQCQDGLVNAVTERLQLNKPQTLMAQCDKNALDRLDSAVATYSGVVRDANRSRGTIIEFVDRTQLESNASPHYWINCNEVALPICGRFFLGQCPTKESISDFWYAVYKNNVKIITQACSIGEVDPYFPTDYEKNAVVEYDEFAVKLISKPPIHNPESTDPVYQYEVQVYPLRLLCTLNCNGPHCVFINVFPKWTENRTSDIGNLLIAVDTFVTNQKDPMMIVCPTGCGRSAVIVAAEIFYQGILNSLREAKTMPTAAEIITLLREQRARAITKEQEYRLFQILALHFVNARGYAKFFPEYLMNRMLQSFEVYFDHASEINAIHKTEYLRLNNMGVPPASLVRGMVDCENEAEVKISERDKTDNPDTTDNAGKPIEQEVKPIDQADRTIEQ